MSQPYVPQGLPAPAQKSGQPKWVLALLAVVVVAVVGVGAAWLWNMATRPGTVTPSGGESCPGGEKVDTVYWSATVPAGWCREMTGPFGIHNPRGSLLGLTEEHHPKDSQSLCDDVAYSPLYKATRVADGVWGGQPSSRYEVPADVTQYLTCTVVKGSVYILLGNVGRKNDALNLGDTKENYDAGVQSLLASWTWK